MAIHEISNMNFSDTNPWYKSGKDITMIADLKIPEFKKVSMKVEILNDTYKATTDSEVGNESDVRVLLAETSFTDQTKRKFIIPFKELQVGINTIITTFKDEDAPNGTSVSYDIITVEDRDTFTIHRDFKYSNEYNITGTLKMDKNGKLHSNATGKETGAVSNKNYINMDGRATIKSVTVRADDDSFYSDEIIQAPTFSQNHSEYMIYRIPIGQMINYNSIDGVFIKDKPEEATS